MADVISSLGCVLDDSINRLYRKLFRTRLMGCVSSMFHGLGGYVKTQFE